MGRRNRISHVTDIRNLRELREVRREIDMKAWYTRQRLADNAEATFSIDNLISIVAPPGSVADGIIGRVGTGMATIRGIINGIQMFRSDRRRR